MAVDMGAMTTHFTVCRTSRKRGVKDSDASKIIVIKNGGTIECNGTRFTNTLADALQALGRNVSEEDLETLKIAIMNGKEILLVDKGGKLANDTLIQIQTTSFNISR